MELQPEKASDREVGIRCPQCGCDRFKVVYTRPQPNQSEMRVKQCRACGQRIHALETYQGTASRRKNESEGR